MTARLDVHAVRGRRPRRAMPAFACALLGGTLVAALPFIARHVDGSADEFSGRTVPVLPAIGWIICAALAAVVVTHRLQIWFKVDEGSVLALAYDVLPIVLVLAPVVAVAAAATGHWLLAAAGGALTGYHALLVIPRLVTQRLPSWTRAAPRFRLAVANVYVDNPTPEDAARQLVQCGADLIALSEATPAFMTIFDAAGGDVSHPHRVSDPADTTDYAIAIASRLPLGRHSTVKLLGKLRLAIAEVEIDGVMATIEALNPRSTFDAEGQETWKEQIAELTAHVPSIRGPLVVAGDLNSTKFRPEFEDLRRVGLADAIDALGQAWRPTFSLKSVRPLGVFGRIARIDQALVNDQIRAVHVQHLPAQGSDHVPFVVTLAVRRPAAPPGDAAAANVTTAPHSRG